MWKIELAAAARTIRSSGVSFKSIVFSGLALLLVVALFFIPELIQFQRSLAGGRTTTTSSIKTLQTATAKQPNPQKETDLNKIAALVDSGYLERMQNPAKSAETSEAPAKKGEGSDEVRKPTPLPSGFNWKSLKTKETKDALKNARAECVEIIKTLPSDRVGSRFSLLNFVSGLDLVAGSGAEKSMSATEAVRYLETLHASVAREMLREGVDRVAYKRLMSLNFGPVVSTWSSRLSGQLIPFNPQLTVIKVDMQQKTSKNSRVAMPIQISFGGFVVGEDVQSIEVVSGGIKQETLKLKKGDASGFRRFSVKRFELRGNVLLRVFDDKGRTFSKLYAFYPRARIFENQKGKFSIPEAASEFDPRLDRFFTSKVSRVSSGPSDNDLESQGFERF